MIRASQLVDSYINGNCVAVIEELLGLTPTDIAYFMHYLPDKDHGKVLRLFEYKCSEPTPELLD